MSSRDLRVPAVCALLQRAAIPFAAVRTAGHADEIAVIETEAALLSRLARLAPEIKALGFRYVTLDLGGMSTRHA